MRGSGIVRSFEAREWRSYRDLRLRALADSPDAFGTTLEEALERSEDAWRSQLCTGVESGRGLPLAAALRGALVGMAWAGIVADGSAFLVQMWVSPDARGAGIGRALLEAALDWSRERGAEGRELKVACGNVPARRLYERAGFLPRGEQEPLRPGSSILVQPMRLLLRGPAT